MMRVHRRVIVAVVAMFASSAQAETLVGGVICADTTWSAGGSPYVVTVAAGGSIVVGCDATLTIEPGVEVRFEPLQALLIGWNAWGPGTLVARGTEQSPIIFTSNQPEPAPGDWSRIDFLHQAASATFDGSGDYQSGCILEHAIAEYAGAGGYPAVNVEQSAPFLSYCEARGNAEHGIGFSGAAVMRIENCHVHDNLDGGMHFNGSGKTLSGNTVSGNSGMGMYFLESDGNTLSGNTVSGNTGPGMYFQGSDGNTLSGNTISDNLGGGVDFNNYSFGNTVTGNTITGNGGSSGLRVVNSDNSMIADNIITDNGAFQGGGIWIWSASNITLTGNTISGNWCFSVGGGMFLSASANITLVGNTFEGNTAEIEGGAMYLEDSDNNDPFASNIIRFNHTTSGQAGGIFVTDGADWLSLNGGVDAYNTICYNDGYEVKNNNTFYGGDARYDIDAANVYWCTNDTDVIQCGIYDYFDDASRAMVVWNPYVEGPPAGDLNGDGMVGITDFLLLLGVWGPCPNPCPPCCTGDLDGDCAVGITDFLLLLENWG